MKEVEIKKIIRFFSSDERRPGDKLRYRVFYRAIVNNVIYEEEEYDDLIRVLREVLR